MAKTVNINNNTITDNTMAKKTRTNITTAKASMTSINQRWLLVSVSLLTSSVALANTAQQAIQSQQLPPQTQTKKTSIDLFNLVKPTQQAPEAKVPTQSGQNANSVASDVKRFNVTGFDIQSDATSVSVQEMQNILNLQNTSQISYKELQQKITTLENWLRHEKKLFKATVFMPVQSFSSGRVSLVVKQGSVRNVKLGKNFTENKQTQNALALLQQHIQPNQALTVLALEKAAFQVMDYLKNPVNIVIQPAEQGFYDVLIDTARPPKKVYGSIGVDNLGSEYTNQIKDTFTLGVNNLTGNNDFLNLSTQFITSNQKLYMVSYEKPFIDGQSIAAQWQLSHYKLCCDFESLNATGDNQTVGLEYSAKLKRSRSRHQKISGLLQYKQLKNKQNGEMVGNADIKVVTASYMDEWSNRVADNVLTLKSSMGKLELKNSAQEKLDKLSANTQGTFITANIDYSASVPVFNQGSIKAMFSGQWSDKNLNTAEKKSIGGLDAVRALPYGALVADHALITQIEYEHQFLPAVSGSIFVDASTFARNANTWTANTRKNSFAVVGAGAGLRLFLFDALEVQASVASQLNDEYEKNTGNTKTDKVNALVQAKWHF